MQDRLDNLESKFAYQEQALTELSDALAAQQTRMDLLEQRCIELKARLSALSDTQATPSPEDERPPHY